MSKSRPMSRATRARLGGLGTVSRHGSDHMATIGRKGGAALDRRIAEAAGIPDTLPPDEYAARLKAARKAYYIRLAEGRWGGVKGRASGRTR